MVTIVQEGSVSAPTEGGMFQGKKFWLSQRVPSRNRFIQEIKANGGEVVMSDRGADIILIDHMKVGSESSNGPFYSYQFVEKSVFNKELENLEDHRVETEKPVGKKQSAAPSSSGARRGRNFFTEEEDVILFEALSQPGVKLSGNSIYKKIDEQYPGRHTMHGWRSRWVEQRAPINPDPSFWLNHIRGKTTKQQQGEEEGQARVEGEGDIASNNKAASKKNNKKVDETPGFSLEDDEILFKYADTISSAADELEAWEALYDKHPQHKMYEWRKRYITHILPEINKRSVLQKPEAKKPVAEMSAPAGSIDKQGHQKSAPPAELSKHSPKTSKPQMAPSPLVSDPGLPSRLSRSSPSSTPKSASLSAISQAGHSTAKSQDVNRWRVGVSNHTDNEQTKETGAEDNARKDAGPPSGGSEGRDRNSPLSSRDQKKSNGNAPRDGKKRKRDTLSPPYASGGSSASVHGRFARPQEIESTPEPEPRPEEARHATRPGSPELGTATPRADEVSRHKRRRKHLPTMEDDKPPSFQQPPPPPPDEEDFRADFLTEDVDLAVPALPSSLPTTPRLPQEDEEDPGEKLQAFIRATRKKYRVSEDAVLYAIKRTSGIRSLAEAVCEALSKGEGLPQMRGVWTEEEDEILMGGDSRKMARLEKTKGGAMERLEWLEMYNVAD